MFLKLLKPWNAVTFSVATRLPARLSGSRMVKPSLVTLMIDTSAGLAALAGLGAVSAPPVNASTLAETTTALRTFPARERIFLTPSGRVDGNHAA